MNKIPPARKVRGGAFQAEGAEAQAPDGQACSGDACVSSRWELVSGYGAGYGVEGGILSNDAI